MIIFVPAYDQATHTNLAMINALATDNKEMLLGNEATRENLLSKIIDKENLFIMSHGSKEAIYYGVNDKAIHICDKENITNKKIFAFACHTAALVGKEIASNNNVWWGYTGAISASDSEEEAIKVIAPIFEYIINNFYSVMNNIEVNSFLSQVKELCEKAEEEFDVLEKNTNKIYFNSRLSLNHIWSRLRVWLDGSIYKHLEAPEPSLFP